jgi:hypothetical protein
MSVVMAILYVITASAAVSFALGAFGRTRIIILIGSLVITELFFLILEYRSIASSSDAPEIILLPIWLAIVMAPIILLTSWACVTVAPRLRRAKTSP